MTDDDDNGIDIDVDDDVIFATMIWDGRLERGDYFQMMTTMILDTDDDNPVHGRTRCIELNFQQISQNIFVIESTLLFHPATF